MLFLLVVCVSTKSISLSVRPVRELPRPRFTVPAVPAKPMQENIKIAERTNSAGEQHRLPTVGWLARSSELLHMKSCLSAEIVQGFGSSESEEA